MWSHAAGRPRLRRRPKLPKKTEWPPETEKATKQAMKRQLEASMKIVVDAELLARDIPEGLRMAATEVSLVKSRALALLTATSGRSAICRLRVRASPQLLSLSSPLSQLAARGSPPLPDLPI